MISSTSSTAAARFCSHPKHAVSRRITWLINVIDTSPILAHSLESQSEKTSPVTLTEMAAELGTVDPTVMEKLADHQAKLARYDKIQGGAILASFILIGFFFGYVIFPVINIGFDAISSLYGLLETTYKLAPFLNLALQFVLILLLLVLVYLLVFVPSILSLKTIAILTDRRYAESINLWTLICLMLELRDDNILQNSSSRKALVQRIHDLALGTSLLSIQNPIRDGNVKAWNHKHFHHLRHYILDRECWVVAPMESTLGDLRRDFGWLLDIYLSGMYGRLNWQEEAAPESGEHHADWSGRLTAFLPRLVALLIPIGIFVYLILNPAIVQSLDLPANSIGIFTLFWGLLGIDKLLGLNAISSLVDFLKVLKEAPA